MHIDRAAVPASTTRAVGLAIGILLDRTFADPARWHPVAGMGVAAGNLERLTYRDTRAAGVAFTTLCVGTTLAVSRAVRGRGALPRTAAVAAATWAVLGGTSLARVGDAVADAIADDDDAARILVPSLCGRDPQSLDGPGIIRAAVESVAENTSDAAVAPLFWGAIAGVPGLLTYRMINTLDAMVGYRSPRYLRFGWASARLDDLANHTPARISGLIVMGICATTGRDGAGTPADALRAGTPADALRAWKEQAHLHPSPNAGIVESVFAGALGVGLGGTTVYPHRTEQRPRLGYGPAPTVDDLYRTVILSRRVQMVSAVAAVLGPLVLEKILLRRR